MHFIVGVLVLVGAYRFSYNLERRPAMLLGFATGFLLTVIAQLFTVDRYMSAVQFAVHAAVGMGVLGMSFRLTSKGASLLVTLLNLVVGSACALILPMLVLDWMARATSAP
ncbi:MAG TPA: hypothetical protein VF950_06100 [Planctomycetota bacterium]